MELQLQEALKSDNARSTIGSESNMTVEMNSKAAGDNMDSAAVTRRLEEELLKRDALIEVFFILSMSSISTAANKRIMI